jgi:hypothetical protein
MLITRPLSIAVVGMLLLPGALLAGQFRYSLGRGDSLKAKVPVAPAVRLGRSMLAIEVRDGTVGAGAALAAGVEGAVPVTQIQSALDQVFGQSFSVVQANGEVTVRVFVTHYSPAESRIESITQKMRVAAAPNPDGTPVLDPQTGQPLSLERSFVVEQWTAKGELAVRVEAVDASGALVDTFTPQAVVKGTATVSVDGQDRVDRTQIPTSEQVRAKLVADLAAQFAPRYGPPATELEIPLAVDEELRPGNKAAQAGDYAVAAQSWREAQPKKGEAEGDRLHNLGAIFEAQGYAALRQPSGIAEAEGFFRRAAEQYGAAREADPKEKYIARALDRARKGLALAATFAQLEQRRQQALAAQRTPAGPAQAMAATPESGAMPLAAGAASALLPAQAAGTGGPPPMAPASALAPPPPAAVDPALEEAMNAALNDPRPDTEPESLFRQLVRLRVRALPGGGAEEARASLETAGATAFRLTALQARRVVHQEIRDWVALQPKIAIYRDSFTAFAQDGRIVPSEREALQTLAKNLGLPETDVQAIESEKKVQ